MDYNNSEKYKKLFIRGLNYESTNETVKTYFEQWGNVVDAIVVKYPNTGRSRGFGFVTYTQSYMVDQAIVNRPHEIDNQLIDTQRYSPRNLMPIYTKDIAVPVTNTFVYGITQHSENDLREYFEQFGKIVNITIVTDKYTGQRKGYGFIEYENPNSAKKVIFMRIHDVAGVKLYLRKAIYRHAGGRGIRGNRRIHDNQVIRNGQDIQYIRGIKYIGFGGECREKNCRNRFSGNHGYQNNLNIRGGESDVSTGGYSLNSDGACQGSEIEDTTIIQNCAISYPLWYTDGNCWGYVQQTGENWCPNQFYVFGGLMNPINNMHTPYVF